MNAWARLLTSLHGTVATTASKILFWLTLRRLTAALDELFTAWRNGELPPLPQPAPAAAESAPAPRAPVVSHVPSVRPRATANPRRTTPRTPRPAPIRQTRRPIPAWTLQASPPPQTALYVFSVIIQKMRHFRVRADARPFHYYIKIKTVIHGAQH